MHQFFSLFTPPDFSCLLRGYLVYLLSYMWQILGRCLAVYGFLVASASSPFLELPNDRLKQLRS